MRHQSRVIKFLSFLSAVLLLSACSGHPSILNPKGVVAFEERRIIFDTAALMLIVVIPVIVMSFVFVSHYRRGRSVDQYIPNWHHSVFLEVLWWGIPIAIVTLIAVITWYSTHQLDPYRRIHYPGKLLKIKVVALPWKWLFVYDDLGITTVNHLVIPEDKQIELSLTSDNVPMSSFAIPQLASQIYTMAGMQTKLHLIADAPGQLEGFNAQFNGYGFANMRFTVDILSISDFKKWPSSVKANNKNFDNKRYLSLREPSPFRLKPADYSGTIKHLFKHIIHAYKLENHPSGERVLS